MLSLEQCDKERRKLARCSGWYVGFHRWVMIIFIQSRSARMRSIALVITRRPTGNIFIENTVNILSLIPKVRNV